MVTLKLHDLVGPLAITQTDGETVYAALCKGLDRGLPVCIDFTGIENITTLFLNAAIGHLYGAYREAELDALLSFDGLDDDFRSLVTLVVNRAKQFYADPKVRAAIEAGGDDD